MSAYEPTILIVEDSRSTRSLLGKVFEEDGYHLLYAAGVSDSKRHIDAERVDLAIVDFWLPDGEGSEVIRYLSERRPAAQSLIVTALGPDRRVDEMIKNGALAHITKPFDLGALRAQAERALTLSRLARENEDLQAHVESFNLDKRLRDRELEVIQQLAALNEELGEFHSIGELALEIISSLFEETGGAQLAYYFAYQPREGLALRHQAGLSPEECRALDRLLPERGLVGEALSGRRLAASRDLGELPVGYASRAPRPLPFGRAQAAVALPVLSRGRPLGVLVAGVAGAGRLRAAEELLGGTAGRFFAVAMENAFLAEMARVDGLTGLYNRGYFDARIEQELSRARRYRHPLALCLADLDGFKSINDTHGHLVGDRVLREVSRFWKSGLRMADFAARYGGEEIVLVLPETEAAGAERVAEKIRVAVGALRLDEEAGGPLSRVTVSIGVAAFPADGGSVEELVRTADEALYRAKAAGGNRVVRAGEKGHGA